MSDNEKKLKFNNDYLSILFIVIIAILLIFALVNIRVVLDFFASFVKILEPIIIGTILAFIISPFCNKVSTIVYSSLEKSKIIKKENKKKAIAKGLGISASLLLYLIVLLSLIFLVIPEFYSSVTSFSSNFERYNIDIKNMVERLDVPFAREAIVNSLNQFVAYLNEVFGNFQQFLYDNLLPNMTGIIKNIYSGVVSTVNLFMNIGIGIIIMIYSLYKQEFIRMQLKKIIYSVFPTKVAKDIIEECRYANDIFASFITGKLIDSAIIFVICYVLFEIIKMPYVFLLSVLVGVTNIVPFFGPIVGGITATILVLFASPDKVIVFAIAVFLIQQFDGNILGPKILGDATGVDNFYVLCAILIFGGLFGFIGMIIAVPLWAIIHRIVNKFFVIRLKKKGLPTESKDFKDY